MMRMQYAKSAVMIWGINAVLNWFYNLLYYESMVNILGLAVSSDYRRRGVGKSLLQYSENWAKESGINIMRLNSGISRKEAHEFYRAVGYDDEKGQLRFSKELE